MCAHFLARPKSMARIFGAETNIRLLKTTSHH